ncbi:CopG family transcriptional regulator [Okeania sp. SIO2C9]|uniref:CopG family transcriptional regulator n=1 Tax=Okeania sp. SIO2C9 TaxID=2607791 RepID=UPI0025F95652|nr:CopG family transcriptional regulator [Okeania sp. SIO2C9]
MTTPELKTINFRVPPIESDALDRYCELTQRNRTEILRELIRTLPTYKVPSVQAKSENGTAASNEES